MLGMTRTEFRRLNMYDKLQYLREVLSEKGDKEVIVLVDECIYRTITYKGKDRTVMAMPKKKDREDYVRTEARKRFERGIV